jgi:hypothetical protein
MHGLDREQLYWFWKENYTTAVMNGGQPEVIHRLTRQEFPAIYSECFMADSTMDFYAASLVAAAMIRKPSPSAGALKLLCVDPAGDGQDKPFVCDRQGTAIGARVWGELANRDYNAQADWLKQTYERFDMDAILIDVTGIGKGLVDATRLRMRGLGPEKVIAVNFAYGALNDTLYGNRRTGKQRAARLFVRREQIFHDVLQRVRFELGRRHFLSNALADIAPDVRRFVN